MAYCKIAIFFSTIVLIGGLFENAHGGSLSRLIIDKIHNFIEDENLTCKNYKEYCARKGEEAKNMPENEHIKMNGSPDDVVSNCEFMLSALLCDHNDYGKE